MTTPETDATLVRRAVDGDQRAWELIVARHGPYLRAIGQALWLSGEESSDALQETWLSAVLHLTELRDTRLLRPWLATTMRRSCQRMRRRRRYDRESPMGDVAQLDGGQLRDEHVDVEREVLLAERAWILRAAMRQLPDRDRALLQLISEDLSYDEIARRLAMPVGSIGPTRMRALRRMRVLLEPALGDRLVQAA